MTKVITRAEVKKNRHRNSLWLIIHDEVYDVTKFVEEHPGGEDTLLDAGGTDATVAFEDVGHSEDARELLLKYKIGKLPDDEKSEIPTPVKTCDPKSKGLTSHVGPELTSKGSKTARFVVPPDKCDEGPTSTTAASKIVCDNEKSNWKWWALAVLVLGAIAAGVMVAKKKA